VSCCRSITPIPGLLYTVNPIAVNSPMVDVFTSNKRIVVLIDSASFGLMAFIAVGATLVGSIHLTVSEGSKVAKGDELGYFAFGGSTCIVLVGHGQLRIDSDLQRMSAKCAPEPLS
jgi:phosphatidylserine decarboxylase